MDTRGRLGRVDGRYPHCVLPYEGERFSIIYYRTAGEVTPHGPAVAGLEEAGASAEAIAGCVRGRAGC